MDDEIKADQRSQRRHHLERIRAKRSKYVVAQPDNVRRMGQLVHTATPCSCWMCGNPRRHHHEQTRNERLHQLLLTEEN